MAAISIASPRARGSKVRRAGAPIRACVNAGDVDPRLSIIITYTPCFHSRRARAGPPLFTGRFVARGCCGSHRLRNSIDAPRSAGADNYYPRPLFVLFDVVFLPLFLSPSLSLSLFPTGGKSPPRSTWFQSDLTWRGRRGSRRLARVRGRFVCNCNLWPRQDGSADAGM